MTGVLVSPGSRVSWIKVLESTKVFSSALTDLSQASLTEPEGISTMSLIDLGAGSQVKESGLEWSRVE